MSIDATGTFTAARTDEQQPQGTGRHVTAVAHPNMALVKYWGKRDESLILPVAGSLSMTLDIFPTSTQVTLTPESATDIVILDGAPAAPGAATRVREFLDLVRSLAGRHDRALVESRNTVPTGAGLASSASGFAALAAAAATAYGVPLDPRALSRLARRGSGSACRSIFGDFAQWHAGTGFGAQGDESSFAEPVESALDPALVIAVVDTGPKAVSSRVAMRESAATSAFYLPWVSANAQDLEQMRRALAGGDLERVGWIAERNALGMHALLMVARPAVRYLSPYSVAVLDRVERLRKTGTTAYATIDAGPNVAVLCAREDAAKVVEALRELGDFVTTHIAGRGPGVTVSVQDNS
ncbi:diphosphomevalonate decarboxylase [Nocardia sp. alder85J]|uniref:diphosphomevalonate decarboxylase n=1 Tax=Nocardia sp. alder85J TaxID=2862949 RepID=UPI001CD263E1|nr:diphosphomevalonate decarboxylase [Nocardia sp. alder85J]MCX4095782.1 diphosphomevalonate decarboxylase [Nocardia sp. alder85J]